MTDQQMAFGEGTSAGLIRDLRVAITREMDDTATSVTTPLLAGRRLSAAGCRSVWSFAVEPGGADALQPESPCRLTHPRRPSAEARILAVGDESVVMDLPAELDDGEGWILASDARFIHERLLERLEELVAGDCDEALLTDLLLPDAFVIDEASDGPGGSEPPVGPDEEQQRAARRTLEPGIRFTWGPPGTGKTQVLGMAVAQAAIEGRRVLVLAHANVAVDVALERIADELGADHPLIASGKVVRLGTPQTPAMAARHDLLPDHIAQRADPGAASGLDALTEELRELSGLARTGDEGAHVAERIQVVRSELRAARAELDEHARAVVDEAAVVATTLARSVITEAIWSAEFDLVVIDEASMAPLPIVLALVMRGARTVSFFGDFRQLPPVAVSDAEIAQQFFATDVFEFGEVVQLHEQGLADPRLSVLRTQFRMGEQICAVVNDLAYDGLLRTAATARDAAIRSAERGIAPGDELVIVDTSTIGARCEAEVDPDNWSRCNLRHAVLVASLAQSLRADGFESVGVISPYRAQVELLAPLVRRTSGIAAATIHRFQGSECDAIVLDLTDAPPMRGPSTLTGGDASRALRLFNVAVSRARHKLIVVADTAFIREHMPLGAVPQRLQKCMDDAGAKVIDGAGVLDLLARRDSASMATLGSADPVWAEDWAAVARMLSPRIEATSVLEANVVEDPDLADLLLDLDGRLRAPGRTVARARSPLAQRLEPTEFDLRLHTRGDTPFIVLDERIVAVGSAHSSAPIAVAENPHLVQALRRVVAPKDS